MKNRVLLALLVAAAAASGCVGALQGGTFSFGPPDRPAAFYLCQAGVTVTIKGPGIGTDDTGLSAMTPTDGVARFPKVPGNLAALNLFLTAPGRPFYGHVIMLPAGTGPIELFLPDCQPALATRALLPPYRLGDGPLHTDGVALRDETNATWRYGFVTDFRLFDRFLAGQAIGAIVQDRISVGANGVRVLLMARNLFDLNPAAHADFLPKLDVFLSQLADAGLRCECVVFADAQLVMPDVGQQRAWLDQVAPVLAAHWNVIGELANEYTINGIDPANFTRPSGAILWERGSGAGDDPPFLPPWDLIGDHPGRVPEWPRRTNCRDIIADDHVPCVENEPMGAAEVARGDRSTSADDFRYWGAVAALETNGSLFHSDDGLQSVIYEPVQRAMALAFFQGLHWPPADAALWAYRRGGLSGPAASLIAHDDALALRTFCKENGIVGYCVAIRPAAAWTATAVDGWRITGQPARGLVELATP